MTRALKQAIDAAPASMSKISRGKPARRTRFKAYTVSQLLETYRDPRAVLMEIASTETATLAKTLNCSLQDALAERRLCAQAVMPYVASKMPVMVDMRHTRAIALNIVDERQYQTLIEAAAEEQQSDDAFTLQLINGQATDDKPVTPSVAVEPGEGE